MRFAHAGWRQLAPSLATGLTLLLGLGAIDAARFGDTDLGLRLVLLAILSDGIDGVLARRWGVASNFGSHLDALADLVAFGVAPGVLFAAQHPETPGPIRVAVIACIAIAGAWRLARFQTEPPLRHFVGLPITAGGPLFALAVAGFQPANPLEAVAWALLLGGLMASRVPFPRFTTGRLARVAFVLAVLFILLLALELVVATNGKLALAAAQIALVTYVGWGLARGLGQVAFGGRPATGGRGRGN